MLRASVALLCLDQDLRRARVSRFHVPIQTLHAPKLVGARTCDESRREHAEKWTALLVTSHGRQQSRDRDFVPVTGFVTSHEPQSCDKSRPRAHSGSIVHDSGFEIAHGTHAAQ